MSNKYRKTDSEIIKYIEQHMEDDIHKLLKNEELSLGGRSIPEFNEFGVYEKIIGKIETEKKRNLFSTAKWACAIALVLFNIGYFTYNYIADHSTVYHEVCTARGERIIVLLPDGTKVWLNADSRLVYPERFIDNERKVALEGEAYFEVIKNSDNPFLVQADEMKIRVTGTSFNVSAYPADKNIVTTLDEGKVFIGHYAKRSSQYEMSPGQTAVYEKGSSKCKILTDEYYKDASGWKENRLSFRNTPLDDVLTELSRQFDVTFEIRENKISSFTYNFVCKGNDLGYILKMMSSITPIQFKEISEGKYIVK